MFLHVRLYLQSMCETDELEKLNKFGQLFDATSGPALDFTKACRSLSAFSMLFRTDTDRPSKIVQVRGDGNCYYHALRGYLATLEIPRIPSTSKDLHNLIVTLARTHVWTEEELQVIVNNA